MSGRIPLETSQWCGYGAPTGQTAGACNPLAVAGLVPQDVHLSGLWARIDSPVAGAIRMSADAPGADGLPFASTQCTIPAGETTCARVTPSALVPAGSYLNVQVFNFSGANNPPISFGYELVPAD